MKARSFILATSAAFALVVPAAHAADLTATTIIRPLDLHSGQYQVEIENTSGIGYINTFNWVPPDQMKITAVTSSKGGMCRLANNMLMCTGVKQGIAPPTCTCHAGGRMTVNFTATGNLPTFNGRYWTYYGIGSHTDITQMTPVPYHIPSYQSPQANFADVPLCDPGTQPTDAHPCYVE